MDFFDRLLDEKMELEDRISSLESFLVSKERYSIGQQQLYLLHVQLDVMNSYLRVLYLRVKDLRGDKNG